MEKYEEIITAILKQTQDLRFKIQTVSTLKSIPAKNLTVYPKMIDLLIIALDLEKKANLVFLDIINS